MTDLFFSFLNRAFTAGWIVLAVLVLRLLLKKAPRKYIVILWAAVALRLLLPFSIESAFSLLPSGAPVQTTQNGEIKAVQSGIPVVDRPVNAYIDAHRIVMLKETESVLTKEDSVTVQSHISGTAIASYVWMAGAAALLGYALYSYLILRKKIRASIVETENVYLCDDIDTPFILGVFRPRIYVPGSLNTVEKNYVLAHERAHLARKDHWWKVMGYLLLAVYWFQPLLWIAYVMLCKDIEIACDERVIAGRDADYRKAYAGTLLACAAQGRFVTACPLAFGEVSVKERILSVMHYKKPGFWAVVISVAACVVVSVCFLTNPKTEKPSGETAPETNRPADIPAPTYAPMPTQSPEATLESNLSFLEQFETAEDKMSFLRNTHETEFDMWEYNLIPVAEEAKTENPALYEALQDPAQCISACLELGVSGAEIYHADYITNYMVEVYLTAGGKRAYLVEEVDGFYLPYFEVPIGEELYNNIINWNECVAKIAIDDLKAAPSYEYGGYDPAWGVISSKAVRLDEVPQKDIQLYGVYGGYSMVLRHKDILLPIWTGWMSPQMIIPKIFVGDYDNDGDTEYALWTHMYTGTGASGDQLYIIETGWNKGEDGFAEYTINEYTHAQWLSELTEYIGYQYDAKLQMLTLTNGGYAEAKVSLKELLDSYESEFEGVGFGDIFSFDINGNNILMMACGGIMTDKVGHPMYDISVIANAKVNYKDGNYSLSDFTVAAEDYDLNRKMSSTGSEFGTPVHIYGTGADLDHDGKLEWVAVDGYVDEAAGEKAAVENALSLGSAGCFVKVYDWFLTDSSSPFPEDRTLLYVSRMFHASHPGNGALFLSRKDGQDYLVYVNPYRGQGLGTYEYAVFYFGNENTEPILIKESGYFCCAEGDKESPVWAENYMTCKDAKESFLNALMPYAEDSDMLIGFEVDADKSFIGPRSAENYLNVLKELLSEF